MSPLMILGIIAFVSAIGCAIGCTFLITEMAVELNMTSPPSEQINPWIGYPGKISMIIKRHRTSFPQSIRGRKLRRLMIAAISLFLVAFLLIFVPPNV